ncbi:MAG: hypothetical protein HOH43_09180 [Candidatus Latescibacteria bacterium]|nr:hypothetical protein [Candidatus Latescibacterota bacterium]
MVVNSPVTYRAGIIGLLFSVLIGVGGQHVANILNAPNFAYTHIPMCLLIPFLALILAPNAWLKSRKPELALSPSELLIIFSMGLIASIVPDWAMNWYLMSAITVPRYYASPENQWENKFFEYLPDWLVLDRITAKGFFEGHAPGGIIPWASWATPMFWWFSLIIAMLFVGACMVVILRKQWVDYERLRFPLCEISTHLIGADEESCAEGSGWPAFYRTRIFRVGFIVMLSAALYNCMTFWTGWPHIPIMGSDVFAISLGRGYPALPIRLNIFSLCFAFFINAEILFSLWFFQLVGIIQTGFMNRIGLTSASLVPGGLVSIQFIGGMIFFVLWGLWMARHHLKEVTAHAFGKSTSLDDGEELFSYRTAVFGLILGFVYIIYWLHQAGVSIPTALLFLFFLYVFYLAMARVLAEAGLVMLDLPINAHQFTVSMVGSANLSVPTLTGMTLTNAFARNWRTFTMVATAHAAWFKGHLNRMGGRLSPGRRHRGGAGGFFLWICLAFAASAASSMIYLIYAGYTLGEQSLRGGAIGSLGNGFYAMAIAWIDNATQISELEVIFLGSGGLITGLMVACRYLFYWWPLHPIGFVVGASSPIRVAFLPFFLAWLVQIILLRVGGVRLYRSVQPLFLGMLVGYVAGAGITYIVDWIWFIDTPHLYENFF